MKAKELMIGDWVYNNPAYFNDDYNGVTEFPDELQSYKIERGEDLEETGCYSPIPLTAEILEKNGFVNSGGLWHLSGEDMGLMQGCISFQAFAYYADPRYCFCEIAYLHELQHALRLCGIDKEIVL